MDRLLIEGSILFLLYSFAIFIVILLIAVFVKLRVIKSPPFTLLVHLQFVMLSRLLFCFLHSLPEYYEDELGKINYPPFLEDLCSYLDQFTWYVLLFNHVTLCLYRYAATCRHALHIKLKRRKNVLMSLVMIWLVSLILVAIPASFNICCPEVFHYGVSADDLDALEHPSTNIIRYFTFVLNWLGFIVTFGCFWKIRQKLYRVHSTLDHTSTLHTVAGTSSSQAYSLRLKDGKISLQLFIIAVVFTLVCIFIFILEFISKTVDLISLLYFVYCLNAIVDAVVIFYFNVNYLNQLRLWFSCCKISFSNQTAGQNTVPLYFVTSPGRVWLVLIFTYTVCLCTFHT